MPLPLNLVIVSEIIFSFLCFSKSLYFNYFHYVFYVIHNLDRKMDKLDRWEERKKKETKSNFYYGKFEHIQN